MENQNEICRASCDSCKETDLGVMFSHLGAPVLFQCRRCDPKNFEVQSRRDIDSWLSGQPQTNH